MAVVARGRECAIRFEMFIVSGELSKVGGRLRMVRISVLLFLDCTKNWQFSEGDSFVRNK